VRDTLKILLQIQLSIYVADTFTGWGVILRKGDKKGTVGSRAVRVFFVRGDVLGKDTYWWHHLS
jgi:hypothetical protein